MDDPRAITVHCDGAMDYDTKQTGGNGFVIDFPEVFDLEPIMRSLRNDRQGVHRLEMISIFEAIEELISLEKRHPGMLKKASGVLIYTDRLRVTDNELLNPYRLQDWRRNGWNTHEGKPVKDKDLLDRIDKSRKKLSQIVGGRVEVNYKRRKQNKLADKLSKMGKKTTLQGKHILLKKNRQVSRREFDGVEIDYSQINEGDSLFVRVYAWERVQDQFEISVEIIDGPYTGRSAQIYIPSVEKENVHRHHNYEIQVINVYTHHLRASFIEFK